MGQKSSWHFIRSCLATADLKKVQNVPKPLCLTVPTVPTHWNSEYFLAKCLLELRLPAFSVLMNQEVTKQERANIDLLDSSWKVLDKMLPVLKPLADATEALTKEDSPTLSQVFVLCNSLVEAFERKADDSATVRNLK